MLAVCRRPLSLHYRNRARIPLDQRFIPHALSNPTDSASTRARSAVRALRASRIREVADVGMGREDVLVFWFGEPDEVTPEFIRQAGKAALDAGDTFYTQNLGIASLRAALATYISGLRASVRDDEIAVTNSGMSALMLATQALVGPGDRVVIVTPLWPNLVEIPKILGAQVQTVALQFGPKGWYLDLDRLLATLTPQTRALYLNTPNNPTGWTLSTAERDAIVAHCRRHGIWMLSDDAYERLCFDTSAAAAPSLMDVRDPQDRMVSTNTFSKSWLMTGWRLGWIVAPRPLIEDLGTLIEYNTSCAPGFVQRAGVVAVTQGEPVIARTRVRFQAARDHLLTGLASIEGVLAASPPAAMYAFFRVQGMNDSLAFCKRAVQSYGLGLAPGVAFGPEGEGYLRWCFAATPERLSAGLDRFARALGDHHSQREPACPI
ncbi:MAG: aminotransferase class I/II-fold pyridoxal phosphate-dependent enzyme [Betaproteobacteria bacterium]|nr:aminotransferase class I/II-fold pyridoxal phosphate-dependent enzyme [Betaproteobacteria bacterium]